MSHYIQAGGEISLLQKGKGTICISIIVPTHRRSPGRVADKPGTEKLIKYAKEWLRVKYTESDLTSLLQSLDELYKEIDFMHNFEGIGLYVSDHFKMLVQFPFPVEEKVMVGDSFEVRDLLYKQDYGKPYLVLLISENRIRLFRGSWRELEEIKNEHFPRRYEEEYIYNHPSRSTSYAGEAHVKDFEKDKSVLEEIRFKDFFIKTDDLISKYNSGNNSIILLGSQKELAWFETVTSHKISIAGKLYGNYDHESLAELAAITWPVMYEHLQQERRQLIDEFIEKSGWEKAISGISRIWQAASEGRALKLIVEKDYRVPGFVGKDDNQLYLHAPAVLHHIVADAVDDLMEMVLEKNGTVTFVDNDLLKDYNRIALITRY
jgi:hypothetical protein